MQRLVRDLRYAARQAAGSPGFTALAVLVLAVGIGGSTAIFGAVDRILLRPLALPDSDRLVRLCEAHPEEGCFSVSPPNAASWAERSRTLEAIGLGRGTSWRMRRDGRLEGVAGGLATPGLFAALGVSAERGRLIQEEDMLPAGDARVAVLSDAFWRTRLGADPDVVGTRLTLDDEEFTVVGVLGEGVEVPQLEWARVWIPVQFDPRLEENRNWRGFRGYGRLRPGASVAEAEAELEAIQAALAESYPEALRGWGADVVRMKDFLVGRARPLLLLFLGAVVVVLLIVCVNLASFLLARATARQRELAVRSALGADRATLVRQLLTEAGLLAAMGGLAGVLVALWTTDLFIALAPPGIPRIDELGVDGRILGFAIGVTALSALVFGLAPAARLRGFQVNDALRGGRSGGAGAADTRLRRALVVTELALALMLVLSAGLLLRSFGALTAWDPGFSTGNLLTYQLYPPRSRFGTDEALVGFYDRAVERFAAIPGVESVGTVSAGPLFGGADGVTPFRVEGRPAVPLQDAPRVAWYNAGPGYFPTLGVDVLEGRQLGALDRAGATPAGLVNESMARRHWPEGSPVGARLSLPEWDAEIVVVGVVPDLRPFIPDQPVVPAIYVSNRQHVRGASFFVVRTTGDPGSLAGAVRAAVRELDPDMEPSQLMTLDERVGAELRAPRFNALLVGLFAVIALVLGAAGVYGVVAYAVILRRREIGIRIALGADRRDVLRGVLYDGLRLAGLGLALGLAGSLLFTRLVAGLLHGVSPADPWAIGGTILILALTAALASVAPAFRASRTDPMGILREE